MPLYLFSNPKNPKDIIEVSQSMNEPHVYFRNGEQWNREFTIPQGSVNTKLDPFDSQQYIDKIGSQKGTMGDALARSAELSEQRAEKLGGQDPVKEKFYKEYSAKRRGTQHPTQIKEKLKNTTFTI